MSFEIFYKLHDSKWNEGIFLQEYKDEFFLMAGGEGKEGSNWKKWVFPQLKSREPAVKAIPLQIRLGDRVQAKKLLEAFLENFKERS